MVDATAIHNPVRSTNLFTFSHALLPWSVSHSHLGVWLFHFEASSPFHALFMPMCIATCVLLHMPDSIPSVSEIWMELIDWQDGWKENKMVTAIGPIAAIQTQV